jgi:hypothetical protein
MFRTIAERVGSLPESLWDGVTNMLQFVKLSESEDEIKDQQ